MEGVYRVPAVFTKIKETAVYLNGDGNEPQGHRKLKMKDKKR